MNKKISLIIGITLFILIICAFYTKNNIGVSNKNTTTMATDVIYKGKLALPIENFIKVTSGFGIREGHGVVNTNHTGIDLCGSVGSRVIAVLDGEVSYAGYREDYGNCVEIKHSTGDGKIFYTFYAHMRDSSLQVSIGQQVTIGQVIGTQGSTGNSTGDHLHFEIRMELNSSKSTIDPAPYLFTEKE